MITHPAQVDAGGTAGERSSKWRRRCTSVQGRLTEQLGPALEGMRPEAAASERLY